MSHRDSARAKRLSTVVDVAAGVSLVLKGISKAGEPEPFWLLVAVAIGGGALVLLGTIFHSRLEKRFRHFEAAVAFVESLTCALVGVASIQHGAHFIQYAWLVAAVGFLGAAVMKARKSLALRPHGEIAKHLNADLN